MKLNRRQFIRRSVLAGAGCSLLPRLGWAFSQSPLGIKKFITPLTGLGPTGIPVLTPDTKKYPGTDYYEIIARQFQQTIYSDGALTLAPKFWGYSDRRIIGYNSRYLGGVIVAQTGRPVKIKAYNGLPPSHILPVDFTTVDPLMAAEVGGRHDRMAIHIHGGCVQWQHDGGPFHWYSNPKNPGGFTHGSGFINGPITGADVGWAMYEYPNPALLQSARFVWYHDHAYSITRLNAYAGVASGYLLTDAAEAALIGAGILPNPLGGLYTYGIPLILQDKGFFDPAKDPQYPITSAKKGDLWYPWKYESPGTGQSLPAMLLNPDGTYPCGPLNGNGRWDWSGPTPPPPVSLVAEAFFDTILVNGAPYPTITLPPKRFRFRLLNAAQARFFNLQMYVADSNKVAYPDGIRLAASPTEVDPNGNPLLIPTNADGPAFIQVASEGGWLPAPVLFNKGGLNVNSNNPCRYLAAADPLDPTNGNVIGYNLLLAPAERADLIIDFRGFEGKELILYNDAPAPFPGGDIRNDYYPGAPDLTCIGGAPKPVAGQGPDTRVMMKFVIQNTGADPAEPSFAKTVADLATALPITFQSDQPPTNIVPGSVQLKTLNEGFDAYGRLVQKLGAVAPTDYLATPTEVVKAGEVQQWQIFNFTGDTHPMHFHLVNVTLRSREQWAWTTQVDPVTGLSFPVPMLDGSGNPYALPGTARPADANEAGWKETVRMNPGEVITVDMKFDLPAGQPAAPFSQRLQSSYGLQGWEYVWHCHILEHEEHDMMHALVVTP